MIGKCTLNAVLVLNINDLDMYSGLIIILLKTLDYFCLSDTINC